MVAQDSTTVSVPSNVEKYFLGLELFAGRWFILCLITDFFHPAFT